MGNAKIIPANTKTILLPYQAWWVADPSPIKLIEKSRQTGISWVSAYAQVERRAVEGAQYDGWVSSRDRSLALQFIRDCASWVKSFELAADDLGEVVLNYDADRNPVTAQQIKFATGCSIYSLSSNPDAQAGRRGDRLLDEFALHPDPRQLYAIASPGLQWGGQMEIVSTHRGDTNYFNQLIKEIREGGNPKRISHHRVTLQDALEDGLLWKIQQRLHKDDHRQDLDEQGYFDYIRSQAADEESFQQEYMCNPTDDNAAFLRYELIASCEYKQGEPWEAIGNGRLFAGVDIGRFNDLTVLWVVEKLGDVFYTRHIEELQNMRKSAQEEIIWPWIERCERTCIDKSGLGIGWLDDAQDKFGEHRVEGIDFTLANKEELAYRAKGAMEDRVIRFPGREAIRSDFRRVKQIPTAGKNMRFDAARDANGHADRFWSLALALAAGAGPGAEYAYESCTPKPRSDGDFLRKPTTWIDDFPARDSVGGPVGGHFTRMNNG